MALEKQNISLPIDGGVDTKSDDKQNPNARMANVQNGVFINPGKVKKRPGSTAIGSTVFGSGTALQSSKTTALATRGDELVQVNDGNLYSWSPTQSKWLQKGSVIPLTYSKDPVFTTIQEQIYSSDLTISNNLSAHVVEVNSNTPTNVTNRAVTSFVYMSISDMNSGAALISDIAIDSSIAWVSGTGHKGGANPRCANLGGFFHCFLSERNGSSTTNLYGWRMDASSIASNTTLTTLATDCFGPLTSVNNGNHAIFDVCSLGSNYYVAYISGTNVKVICLDSSFTPVGSAFTQALPSATAAYMISIAPDAANGRVYISVAYGDGADKIGMFALNSNLTSNAAFQVIMNHGGHRQVVSYVDTYLYVFSSQYSFVSSTNQWNQADLTSNMTGSYVEYAVYNGVTAIVAASPTYSTGTLLTYHMGIASKPFSISGTGGGNFINLTMDDPFDAQVITFRLDKDPITFKLTPTLAGRAMYGNYSGTRLTGQVSGVTVVGTKAYWAAEMRTKILTQPISATTIDVSTIVSTFLTAPIRMTMELGNSTTCHPSAQLDANLLIGGGVMMAYDGQSVFENNFLFAPMFSLVTTAAGGNQAAGLYSYIAVYEYTDANGQIHRSPPSQVASYTQSASAVKVTWRIRGYTTRTPLAPTQLKLVVYRTTANGSIYYRLNESFTSFAPVTIGSTGYYEIVDSLSDGNLIKTAESIYTTGGVLPNDAAGCASAMMTHRGRVYYLSEAPFDAYFSKARFSGEPTNFSGDDFLEVESVGGRLYALGSVDEKVVILKKDRTYFVYGDPPDDTGQGSTFSTPQALTTPVGCPYPKSVITVPAGVIFKSQDKGIWLLDRGLNFKYIGAEVEAYNSANITSAVAVRNTTQIRFTLDTGYVLVYDYYSDKWSVWSGVNAASACLWQGVYCYVTSSGVVYQESGYSDNGADISMLLQSSWIHLAGLQGFQRIYRALVLGTYYSAHTLTVQVGYDYEDTWSETHTITPSNVSADQPYQFEIYPARQKCQAIRFKIYDTAVGTPGQGYDLSGLELIVGKKAGAMKTPATKKVT